MKNIDENKSFITYSEMENEVDQILKDTDKQKFIMTLQKVHADYNAAHKRKNMQILSSKSLKKSYLTIAATIAVLLAVGGFIRYSLFNSGKNYETVFEKYYKVYPVTFQNRGAQDQNSLNSALQAYESKDYYKAINLLAEVEKAYPDYSCIAAFYKGLSCIEISDYKNAIQSFNKVISAPYNIYTSNAHWYMALTWMKLNNLSETRTHLKWLIANDRQLGKQAAEMLKEIEK
jgi:TolA-binding protein